MNKREIIYDGYPPETELGAFINWLRELTLEVPMPYLPSAFIECDPRGSYGDYFANIVVGYYRPLTEEENEHFKNVQLAQRDLEIRHAEFILKKHGIKS